jgi:hypothetical protein
MEEMKANNLEDNDLEKVNGGKREQEDQPFGWFYGAKRPYLKNTYARQYAKELTDEEKQEFWKIKDQEQKEAYLFMHNFEL